MSDSFTVDARELVAMIAKFKALEAKIPLSSLRKAGHQIGKDLIVLLLKPTSSWEHKPAMKHIVRVGQAGIVVMVTIDDAPYVWLTLGTRANYPITAKNASTLAFQSGYKAKTSPGSLIGSIGGKFGPFRFAMTVIHPGIQAREFHVAAFEQIKHPALLIVKREIEVALRTVLGAS